MKSIKEKAAEYDKVVKRINADTSLVDMSGRKQFEAGANYVLDEVECILKDNNLWDCEEICNELIALIEQLKK